MTRILILGGTTEARRLAADLIDAATKAETAPPTARTLHLVGGAR